MVIEHEDDLTTDPIGFTHDAGTLYWISSVGRDKAALVAMDWPTGRSQRVLAEHPKADISQRHGQPAHARGRGRRRAASDARLDPAR